MSASTSAGKHGSSPVPMKVAVPADRRACRRPARPGRARPASRAGCARPRCHPGRRARSVPSAPPRRTRPSSRDGRGHRPVELRDRRGHRRRVGCGRARCDRPCPAGSPRKSCRPGPPASRAPERPAPRASGAVRSPWRSRPPRVGGARPRGAPVLEPGRHDRARRPDAANDLAVAAVRRKSESTVATTSVPLSPGDRRDAGEPDHPPPAHRARPPDRARTPRPAASRPPGCRRPARAAR